MIETINPVMLLKNSTINTVIVVQIQNISLLDSLSVQVIKESAEGELPTFFRELSTPTEVR